MHVRPFRGELGNNIQCHCELFIVASQTVASFLVTLASLSGRYTGLQILNQNLYACVVSECLADVNESVHIVWDKNKTATQLERILSKLLLLKPSSFRPLTVAEIISPEQVENVGFAQLRSTVRFSLIVDE
jgi:hypothetical protein